jgi:hypothetical protein
LTVGGDTELLRPLDEAATDGVPAEGAAFAAAAAVSAPAFFGPFFVKSS